MKIGVISDTHIPINTTKLPKKVYDFFKTCDLIVHAGDIVEMSVVRELEVIAETKAVSGNMDSAEVKRVLPDKLIFEAGGKKIGVTHGRGPSFKVMDEVKRIFKKKLDIIIFGHSHMPVIEEKDGVVFFNPGSATDVTSVNGGSFGVIEIEGDDIRCDIMSVSD